MVGLERYVRESGLERSLLELVKFRASQINGCAYCLDAWRETPFYTEREREALSWTEAVTLIADNHVPDELYEQVRQHFSEEELVNLTLAVVTINGWNRLSISFRTEPGTYRPAGQ